MLLYTSRCVILLACFDIHTLDLPEIFLHQFNQNIFTGSHTHKKNSSDWNDNKSIENSQLNCVNTVNDIVNEAEGEEWRDRGLFYIVTVHATVDIRDICSSLTPVAIFFGLKKLWFLGI